MADEEVRVIEQHKFAMSRGAAIGLVVTYVALIVVILIGMWYINYIRDQNNQKWCTAVVAIDDAFKQSQSQSAAAKRIGDAYAKLRRDFEC